MNNAFIGDSIMHDEMGIEDSQEMHETELRDELNADLYERYLSENDYVSLWRSNEDPQVFVAVDDCGGKETFVLRPDGVASWSLIPPVGIKGELEFVSSVHHAADDLSNFTQVG